MPTSTPTWRRPRPSPRASLRLRSWPRCLVLLLLLSSLSAAAEETPVEQAKRVYFEAEASYRLGRFGEAAARYEEAYRLSKIPGILFDIAQAQRRWYESDRDTLHLRQALELYRAYLRDVRSLVPPPAQAAVAERLVPEVEKALAADLQRQRDLMMSRPLLGQEGLALADRLLAAGDNAAARQVLDRVLATPRNPRDVVIGAHERRALVAGKLGDATACYQSFQVALALDPGFRPSEEADPVTKESYLKAWGQSDNRPITITHGPLVELKPGEAAKLTVTVDHDKLSLVEEVALYYRRAGEGTYLAARVRRAVPTSEVSIPGELIAAQQGARIQYYVVARDRREGDLAYDGSPLEPYSVGVAGPKLPPAALAAAAPTEKAPPKRWPIALGVVLGVVAAGAAVTTAVVLTRPQETLLPPWNLRE